MITTFVTYGDKTYRVSTINRESSVYYTEGNKYAETLVWEWDTKEYKVKGFILMQGSAAEDSIRTHQRFVEQIHKQGIKEQDD
jgi:hypothetical protein